MDPADSYLPRVIGIFLAVLDPSQSGGSKVLYQVPSNLITTSASSAAPPPPGAGTSSSMSQSLAALSVNPSSAAPPAAADDLKSPSSARARSPLRARSRSPLSAGARVPAVVGPQSSTPLSFAAADAAAIAAVVPSPPLPPTTTPTPPPSSTPSPPPAPPAPAPASASSPPKPPPLLSFEQIASFCVPQTPLCNRLCTITSGAYKIQGHPMLHEDKDARKGYERHEFRWNVCWVFDRWAYQGQEYNQVVRKVARVLASCEEDSCFISSPATGPKVFEILQQLMEDLNTYAEASIPIDQAASIEIKLFPNLPNPIKVENWHVPIPLIDLKPQLNWDLSMAKVVRFIDGTSHVKRIAESADVAVDFARTCVEHLLYYEAVMLIDIFEWSNMYTVKPSFQTLSVADHVIDECADYCRRDPYGDAIEWATLCDLYTRFRPGLSIDEWEEAHNVAALGIDARRFVTFGVIKGFLRRVHRWPVFRRTDGGTGADGADGDETPHPFGSPRLSAGESGFSLRSLGLAGLSYPTTDESHIDLAVDDSHHHHHHHHYPAHEHGTNDFSPKSTTVQPPPATAVAVPRTRQRRMSRAYEHVRSGAALATIPASQSPAAAAAMGSAGGGGGADGRSVSPSSHSFSGPSNDLGGHHHGQYGARPAIARHRSSGRRRRDRGAADDSGGANGDGSGIGGAGAGGVESKPWATELGYPPGLTVDMLDGDRHEDELGVLFDLPVDGGSHGLGTMQVVQAFARRHGGQVHFVLR